MNRMSIRSRYHAIALPQGSWLIRNALLLALLTGLGLPMQVFALAHAVSSASVNCLSFESNTVNGPITAACLNLEGDLFSRAEAAAGTALGETPTAAVSTSRSNTAGHFLQQVTASARLTYEVQLIARGSAPVNLASVPVTVGVSGTVSRDSQLNGTTVPPAASGDATVLIRSDPSLLLVQADVLRESANTNSVNLPNFNKIVSVSLIPGHVYIVDVMASCTVNDGGSVRATFSSSTGCSAVADPTFTLDQAALDALLGSNTFSLADTFSFAFSPGVSAVPLPASGLLFPLGLSALIARRRGACDGEPAIA